MAVKIQPYALFLEKRNKQDEPVFGGYLSYMEVYINKRSKLNTVQFDKNKHAAMVFNNAQANAAILLLSDLLPSTYTLRKTLAGTL